MDKTGVIILHFGKLNDTNVCLRSLNPQNYLYVILVSNDHSIHFNRQILRKFCFVKIILNKVNEGFAQGNNLGIAEALKLGCSQIILLNNDTILAKDTLSRLIKRASVKDNVGIISPKIFFSPGDEYKKTYKNDDLGKVIWYAGGNLDWKNIYASHRGVDEVDINQFNQEKETDFATGCCMLIKKEVLETVGKFDTKYFLYFEDVDLSLRARKRGFRILYYPHSILWHKNAASSDKPGSRLHVYYQTRNRLYFGFKYANLNAKKSLFLESIKQAFQDKVKRKAILDYYFQRMGAMKI